METVTSWTQDTTSKPYPLLTQDITVDVAILGGGITGILAGYLLLKEGKKVAIIEKDRIGSGVTHLTTAFLTQIIDTDVKDLITIYGESTARTIVESHMSGINLIEKIIADEHIEAYFSRCNDYIYVNEKEQLQDLEDEYKALKHVGLDVSLSQHPLKGFRNHGYLEIKNQAKFHPLKCMYHLAEKMSEGGVLIFEQTEAVQIEDSNQTHIITKNGNTINTSWIIDATYNPFKQPLGLFFKKGTYISYIFELDIPKGYIKEGIYEDTENPYHYFRIDSISDSKDGMLIGGEDRRYDIPISDETCYQALESYLIKTFPGMHYKINKRWNGPVLEPSDGLAFIGPYKNPHVLHAFGFSGNGMTYAGISALILTDIILHRENPYRKLYDTSRDLNPASLAYKARDYGDELIHGALKNALKKS